MNKPLDPKNLPEGAVLFNLKPGAGKQPAFPRLPADITGLSNEGLIHVTEIMPIFLMLYVENDQFDEAKALTADMRRISAELAMREEVAKATCECKNCVARRAAEGEAITAIANAKGIPPAAVNKGGETLH
jgi:hypothetical protein